jgi:hypothetical protein
MIIKLKLARTQLRGKVERRDEKCKKCCQLRANPVIICLLISPPNVDGLLLSVKQ